MDDQFDQYIKLNHLHVYILQQENLILVENYSTENYLKEKYST